MITLRQLERLWRAEEYGRLAEVLLENRPEATLRLRKELARAVPVAAMVIIRLDELNQAHAPFCGEMIRTVLAGQEADGGWGDPLVTAVCLHALMCGNGDGAAIERGLAYLASIQRNEGLWPRIPMRRMPADPFVSAFILYHLGQDPRFGQRIRLNEALGWFETYGGSELDLDTARLWRSIALRRQVRRFAEQAGLVSWS
ncbi:MAG: hypothetical protein ACM359_10160 [Bacillota bacterium]